MATQVAQEAAAQKTTTQAGTDTNSTNVASPSAQLMHAVALHRAGQLNEAQIAYQNLLQSNPNDYDAMHYLGLIAFQKKSYLDAVQHIEAAIHANPNVPAFHCNLGNAYKSLGKLDAAIAAFHEAVRLDGRFQVAYSNLGNAYKEQGRMDEAIASYHKAIELNPNFAEAYNNLGVVLRIQGRLDEAIACYRKALALKPDYADAYGNMGDALKMQDKLEESLFCFEQQARLAPDSATAQHQIAALKGSSTSRAPAQYVEKVFDDYADRFDSHLVNVLKYDIPGKIRDLVIQRSVPPQKSWRILDLGCGTGLVGEAFAPFSRQLVGVDLSSKMLGKARERNLYERLECMDIITMLKAETACYDLIVAADVFVYIGNLDEIVSETRRLLCADGLFAFSIESIPASTGHSTPQEYRLETNGRYKHSPDYITALATVHGFEVQAMVPTNIRTEKGVPVDGYIAIWKPQQ